MKFIKPEIKEVIIDDINRNPSAGKQYCDTIDWSGCCYNG